MTSSDVAYDLLRAQLHDIIRAGLEDNSFIDMKKVFNEMQGNSAEKKATIDQAFHSVFWGLQEEQVQTQVFFKLTDYSIEGVQHELCPSSCPLLLVQDLLDSLPLTACEEVFRYLESHIDIWKSEGFYASGKNYLLRMCNDLLRRLSRSQDTAFCGRILMFLAKLFPLDEKSGINLTSQFNLENSITLDPDAEDILSVKDEKMETELEEGEMPEHPPGDSSQGSVPIDYNLYRCFWTLQEYFHQPNKCYSKVGWKQFSECCEEVLRIFESYRLEEDAGGKNQSTAGQQFFAKYLTSAGLLDLQLSDASFRRYVLLQAMILLQYLRAKVKFKGPDHALREIQAVWARDIITKVSKLLQVTGVNGKVFANTVERIMSREELWNKWKNDGCPSFTKPPDKSFNTEEEIDSSCFGIGEELYQPSGRVLNLGNTEMTRLWNLFRDNLDACKSLTRRFQPSVEAYCTDVIEQMASDATDEEKMINQEKFQWRALRLFSRKSQHFFTAKDPKETLSSYLETMMQELVKTMPDSAKPKTTKAGTSPTDKKRVHKAKRPAAVKDERSAEKSEKSIKLDVTKKPEKSIKLEDIPKKVEKSSAEQQKLKKLIPGIALQLGTHWKQVAAKLKLPADDVEYVDSEKKDLVKKAETMLTLWLENDDAGDIQSLHKAILDCGLTDIAAELK